MLAFGQSVSSIASVLRHPTSGFQSLASGFCPFRTPHSKLRNPHFFRNLKIARPRPFGIVAPRSRLARTCMPHLTAESIARRNHIWASPVTGFFSLLSVDPPIFYLWYREEGMEYLLEDLPGRPVDILLMFGWYQDEAMVTPLAETLGRWRKDFPLVRFHCLANTPEEAVLLRERTGCQTILCSSAING